MVDSRQETEDVLLADPSLSLADARAVECAAYLFLDNGLEAVRMTDIADAAKVGVATLYRHFSTKVAIATRAATMLWQQLEKRYDVLVQSEEYQALSGAEQLEKLLATYCDFYIYRKGFAAFVDDLDRLILAGDVPSELVDAYEAAISSVYHHFHDSYERGHRDGSIVKSVDFGLFYRTVGHALLAVAAKLSRGEVIPSDDFSRSFEELDCLIGMAVSLLKT